MSDLLDDGSFMFTSESVGEGHPGECLSVKRTEEHNGRAHFAKLAPSAHGAIARARLRLVSIVQNKSQVRVFAPPGCVTGWCKVALCSKGPAQERAGRGGCLNSTPVSGLHWGQ